jgi:hypothetical protein
MIGAIAVTSSGMPSSAFTESRFSTGAAELYAFVGDVIGAALR